MGLADRPYMRERARQREEAGRRGRRWIRWQCVFREPYYPLLWMAVLLLLYLAATLVRPHLSDYGGVYCYVWTDYCLGR